MRTGVLALLICSALASAAPSLFLNISGSHTADTIFDLKLTTTLTNTGDEVVTLLNDPRGPLSAVPTDTFIVTNHGGSSKARFTGVKVKFVPYRAVELGAVTVLAPGQSVSVEHNLSEAYSLMSPGEGQYGIEASNLFHVVGDDGSLAPIHATAAAHSVEIKGRLGAAAARPLTWDRTSLGRRGTFNGCSDAQQSALGSAASAAQRYAAGSLSYLQNHTKTTSRYVTWFGTFASSRHSTLIGHYMNMNDTDFAALNYDCTCVDAGLYAYVYPDKFGTVYLCGAYWQAPATGSDSKAGTLVHESSHFTAIAGTDDHAYGQTACKNLAISDPEAAVDNADSHEYFSENFPALA